MMSWRDMREICCGYSTVQSFCTFCSYVLCGGEIDMRPVNWGAKTVENTDVSEASWHRARSQEMSWAPRILAVLNQRQIIEKNVVWLPFASSASQVLSALTKMSSSAMGWRETLMIVCESVWECRCVTGTVKILMWWTDLVYLELAQCTYLVFYLFRLTLF